ncbi:LOW QUALITY PROTEIN: CD177 antigen-like [Arvicanthis niloticus]|uniref:LOW QUALITY PROTEIN: CD177 antigen-like n=1 Tax=Arvicanthis niloticus TaxID=61156 RepID=UPI001486DA55|nr:LOW QUALITY PROTEIN: CD177 antigen-like [Arvicanthis niloticus]
MTSMPVLTLLGVTTLLPCIPGLTCHRSRIQTTRNMAELPLEWEMGEETCEVGEGCQDWVMLVYNGPQINSVVIKGCIQVEDQEPRVTWLRTGPGLSIVTYTHVCRHSDFCNDVNSTEIFENLPTPTVPGSLRCPLCLSNEGCENAPEQVCPAGSTHCYDGVLRLRGGGIVSDLKVQGCMFESQSDCDLFNGTQTIGSINVYEDCGFQLAAEALKCQHGTLETVKDISELPFQWTASQKTCDVGEGCQDTLMIIENGEQVNLVLTKGCTTAEDQEAKVTEHRTGPGLSVTSYTRVCREKDFCNDLSTTAPLWTPPLVTAPGTTRCPLCFSAQACENAPEQVCPAGSTHCYNGFLRLRGGGIISYRKVQGCMSQPGCNLLNGTQKIGPVNLSEDCSPLSYPLTCYWEVMFKLGNGFAEEAVAWSSLGSQVCEPDEICQETLLLIDVGQKSALLGSKGCSSLGTEDSVGVSIFSQPPGMLVASYTRFCPSRLCNDANSSSVLLNILPHPNVPPPGAVQCPVCVQLLGSCLNNTYSVTCPQGATHCYKGDIELQGGGLFSTVSVQGCMAPPLKSLLGDSKTIRIFSAKEISHFRYEDEYNENPIFSGASASSLAWMLGPKVLLSSLCAGICLLC